MTKKELSGVIITKNESANIARCITSLQKVTDDIIVVDDYSEDDTCIIAEAMGARVFQRDWEGYSRNKNFGNAQAKNDWILSLDADEELSDALVQEIRELKVQPGIAWMVNRKSFCIGIPVHFCGWNPDWNIRLFNRIEMRWDNKLVHEKLEALTNVRLLKLKAPLYHYTYKSEAHIKAKFDHYARLRAKEWVSSGKNPGFIKRIFGPAFRFFRTYILKLGILDGKIGWIISSNEYILKKKEWQYFDQFSKQGIPEEI
ncbi:MAG: glycosyltransferase family 2 protein [Saprospiraceae bacterium]|nr:glycosyltransferase family 2 protein [Saprospiraceae bacterium]